MYCRADLLSRRAVFIIDPTVFPRFLFSFCQVVHFSVTVSVVWQTLLYSFAKWPQELNQTDKFPWPILANSVSLNKSI